MKKGFVQIPLLIGLIVSILAITGFSYVAVEYQKTSNLVKQAQQLTKDEKYNEANEKLEFAQNRWFTKTLGIKKQEIEDKIDENKKLEEDRTEYTQGIEEFNKGNWELAKEFLSEVSETSPYYQDAKNKTEEARNKINEKLISEAVGGIQRKTQEQMAALQKEMEEAKRAVKYVISNTNLLGLINYEVLRNVPKGTKVTVVKEESNWSHVKIDSQEGWLENGYLADSIPQSQDLTSIIAQWRQLVVYIECDFRYIDTNKLYYQTGGSGVALNFTISSPDNDFMVITNKHVLTNDEGYRADSCSIKFPGLSRTFYSTSIFGTTNNVDGGSMIVNNPDQDLKSLPFAFSCEQRPSVGEKVVILGYPSIGAKTDITATEGIVSGYEGDYYITSAKIDQGNSGGAAILVEDNCFLGIPTYAITGKIESLGRILRTQAIWE